MLTRALFENPYTIIKREGFKITVFHKKLLEDIRFPD